MKKVIKSIVLVLLLLVFCVQCYAATPPAENQNMVFIDKTEYGTYIYIDRTSVTYDPDTNQIELKYISDLPNHSKYTIWNYYIFLDLNQFQIDTPRIYNYYDNSGKKAQACERALIEPGSIDARIRDVALQILK